MTRLLCVVASVLAWPVLASAAPLTETLEVGARTGPWSTALNPGLFYGTADADAPVATTAAFDFTAGASFTIGVTGGLTSPLSYSGPKFDGLGDTDYATTGVAGTSNTPFPGQYVPAAFGTLYLGELLGAFAHDGVVVGTPFAVGNGTTVTSPGGADQILLGFNDDISVDNTGALTVLITGASANLSPVPLPGGAPLFGLSLLGVGLAGAATRRRRAAR